MADDGRFLCRELCSLEQGELRILDALRWPTPLGTGLRIYTGVGIEAAVLRGTGPGGVDITEIARVAGITVISACGPAGEGAVTLRIAEGSLDLPTALPETDLFDDLDVFIAQRHHETPDQLAEWLRYHTAHHGLTGVVLFDRSEPGPSQKEFATAMQAAVRDIGEIQRFVLVTSPLALGRTKYPALGDPALAPRRKNRSFTPDRWRAPLAEAGLYDILKWRFLTRAGAVIALDPCDVLRPSGDGIGAFQATRKSHTGLMPVQGQMIYPWRVRKGRDPSLGDHICRADPPVRAPGRWALAPKRAAAGTVWLPGAVAGMAGLADETLNYDRASS
ncbi:MAG: hypothetical protein LJE68_17950, partial [Rhodobacter sp.]|nr:hypothetical protein [Rhodobacter sp.]